jgi:hypothetical protein
MAILDALTKSARAAYPIIQRGVREGLSTSRIQSTLTGAGLGVRRQVLLDIIRVERGLAEAGSILRSLSQDSRPAALGLPDAATRTRRSFSYTVELRGIGAGGSATVQHVTVTTDNPGMTIRQITQLAEEMGQRGRDRYGLNVQSATIVRGMKAGEAGTF